MWNDLVNWYVVNLPYSIIWTVGIIAAIITFIVNLVSGKTLKSATAQLKAELEEIMQFKKVDYRQITDDMKEADKKAVEGIRSLSQQTFKAIVDVYGRSKVTNEVEPLEKENLQEKLNSYKVSALDIVLDKYLNAGQVEYDTVSAAEDNYAANVDKLEILLAANETAEEIRIANKLSENVTFEDIISYAEKKAKEAEQAYIKAREEQAKTVTENKEETNENEKN